MKTKNQLLRTASIRLAVIALLLSSIVTNANAQLSEKENNVLKESITSLQASFDSLKLSAQPITKVKEILKSQKVELDEVKGTALTVKPNDPKKPKKIRRASKFRLKSPNSYGSEVLVQSNSELSEIYVGLTSSEEKVKKLEVMNEEGTVLKKVNRRYIYLHDLSPGKYVARITTVDGNVYSKAIVRD
ncbi:MAG: hypothetical protein JJ975_02480 [Bacteroidia bacterium]|nr:hypothetical protein [Bacteroidia bacterium]